MRLPIVTRRHMTAALNLAAAATAHLLDKEDQMLRAERSARRSAEDRIASLVKGRADAVYVDGLERRLQRLVRVVAQLRQGVVDDEQTVELRRQLAQEKAASKALALRLAEVTAANHSYDKELSL